MEDLFKAWAEKSNSFASFELSYNLWIITNEINPDYLYSNEDLVRKYIKYRKD